MSHKGSADAAAGAKEECGRSAAAGPLATKQALLMTTVECRTRLR